MTSNGRLAKAISTTVRRAPASTDVGLEGAEEVVAAPVADRVGDDGHDVEDVGHRLDVLLVIGAPAPGRHRLALTIVDVLEGHAAPGEWVVLGGPRPVVGESVETGRFVPIPRVLMVPSSFIFRSEIGLDYQRFSAKIPERIGEWLNSVVSGQWSVASG